MWFVVLKRFEVCGTEIWLQLIQPFLTADTTLPPSLRTQLLITIKHSILPTDEQDTHSANSVLKAIAFASSSAWGLWIEWLPCTVTVKGMVNCKKHCGRCRNDVSYHWPKLSTGCFESTISLRTFRMHSKQNISYSIHPAANGSWYCFCCVGNVL